MIILAIITLLAFFAIPSYLRARRRLQAGLILEDLKVISTALDLYSQEFNKVPGQTALFTDLKPYFKINGRLYSTGMDVFGSQYGPYSVDFIPQLSDSTFNQLSDVTDNAFWSPFR